MSNRETPPGNRPRRPRATTVPVASRERAKREKQDGRAGKSRRFPVKQDLTSWAILIVVSVAVLLAIAVPLRNYYEGRSEIARLNDSIAALEQRKADLDEEMAKYQDPEYVKQEARRRLGVLEPGETAWRIMDPRMTPERSITSPDEPDDRPWPQVLWDSLREGPGAEPSEDGGAPAPGDAPEAP